MSGSGRVEGSSAKRAKCDGYSFPCRGVKGTGALDFIHIKLMMNTIKVYIGEPFTLVAEAGDWSNCVAAKRLLCSNSLLEAQSFDKAADHRQQKS